MSILSLLTPDRALYNIEGGSKKRTLELVSQLIAESCQLSSEDVFTGLVNREKLGSTGIGEGVAIPHCRLSKIDQAIGALVMLAEPIAFDAIDNKPVDLLFFLMVPEEACDEHLNTLSKLAEVFSQEESRSLIRSANSGDQLMQIAEQLFST